MCCGESCGIKTAIKLNKQIKIQFKSKIQKLKG